MALDFTVSYVKDSVAPPRYYNDLAGRAIAQVA